MLESIRKNSKIVMLVLFLLIIPSFVLVGIDRNSFSSGGAVVAVVDGKDITKEELDRVHRQESDRIRAQQSQIDSQWLDSDQARSATLERLVRDRVLQSAVRQFHLVASDAALARALQEIPAVAALRRADGSLDTQAYRNLVAAQGMTPEGFEASVRHELSMAQVLGVVSGSVLASEPVAELALDAMLQRRRVRLAHLEPSSFSQEAKEQTSEADIKSYYEAHLSAFEQAEQAEVEYLVLTADALAQEIDLNAEDVRSYYDENAQRLSGAQEQRRASHILLSTQEKAQELLERVRADPNSFAALAKEFSEDGGSAVNGGDLGFFARGEMVPEFEQAVFNLEKGAIVSEPVKSDFGYHLIELTDIRPAQVPSFEEMRPSIEKELRTQLAQQKFAEAAEEFTNLVYEQPDSLAPAAQRFGLSIQSAQGVTRQPSADTPQDLANADLLEALFSLDAIENKRNTDAVEVGSNRLVAGRVLSYQSARQLGLEEVQEQVRERVLAQAEARLARQAGERELEALRGVKGDAIGGSPKTALEFEPERTLSRDQMEDVPLAVVEAALQAPSENLPQWAGVELENGGYVVIQVEEVLPPQEKSAELKSLALGQYEQLFAQAESAAYYELLKKRFKVELKVPTFGVE